MTAQVSELRRRMLRLASLLDGQERIDPLYADACRLLLDAFEEKCREVEEAKAKAGPLFERIERILDEESAWIARPNREVSKRIAFAAAVVGSEVNRQAASDYEQELERQVASLTERLNASESLHQECRLQNDRDWRAKIDAAKARAETAEAEIERLREGLRDIARRAAGQNVVVGASQPSDREGWRDTKCATEGCERRAAVHFVRADVGSYYCRECYLKVQALPTPTATTKGEAE